jgi:hypothetical protein
MPELLQLRRALVFHTLLMAQFLPFVNSANGLWANIVQSPKMEGVGFINSDVLRYTGLSVNKERIWKWEPIPCVRPQSLYMPASVECRLFDASLAADFAICHK